MKTQLSLMIGGDLFKFLENQKFTPDQVKDTEYVSSKIHDFVDNFTDMAMLDDQSALDMAEQYLSNKSKELGFFEPINFDDLEDGYYQINGTQKILCWQTDEWVKPEKDRLKRFGTYISKLAEQPKNIKTIKPVADTEFASLYKQ